MRLCSCRETKKRREIENSENYWTLRLSSRLSEMHERRIKAVSDPFLGRKSDAQKMRRRIEGSNRRWIEKEEYLNILDKKVALFVGELIPKSKNIFLAVILEALEQGLRWLLQEELLWRLLLWRQGRISIETNHRHWLGHKREKERWRWEICGGECWLIIEIGVSVCACFGFWELIEKKKTKRERNRTVTTKTGESVSITTCYNLRLPKCPHPSSIRFLNPNSGVSTFKQSLNLIRKRIFSSRSLFQNI